MDFLVGTFNTPHIYSLRFTPPTSNGPSTLHILARHPAIGSHSWLSLSLDRKHVYATAWTEPPSIAAYRLTRTPNTTCAIPELLNTKPTASRSGYVCCSATHIYSAGGPSGEVFAIAADGSVGELVQTLSFIDEEAETAGKADGEARPHGDFGGLRHGAHSADLSADGKALYVADIGRNCVWTYQVGDGRNVEQGEQHLTSRGKHVAPRNGDGPRHTWPHPKGKVLYSLQEHTCMVDIFSVGDVATLEHVKGVRIIPKDKDPKMYWADEVRVSACELPRYMYASTRGLKADTKGYVAVFAIDDDGMVKGEEALTLWETPTSGGWANAIEPAPLEKYTPTEGNKYREWLAMTDSEEGWVFLLGFDGSKMWEEARVKLVADEQGPLPGAATAIWL